MTEEQNKPFVFYRDADTGTITIPTAIFGYTDFVEVNGEIIEGIRSTHFINVPELTSLKSLRRTSIATGYTSPCGFVIPVEQHHKELADAGSKSDYEDEDGHLVFKNIDDELAYIRLSRGYTQITKEIIVPIQEFNFVIENLMKSEYEFIKMQRNVGFRVFNQHTAENLNLAVHDQEKDIADIIKRALPHYPDLKVNVYNDCMFVNNTRYNFGQWKGIAVLSYAKCVESHKKMEYFVKDTFDFEMNGKLVPESYVDIVKKINRFRERLALISPHAKSASEWKSLKADMAEYSQQLTQTVLEEEA